TWEKRFVDKGFVPVVWGDTGWVHLFLRKEVKSVKELKGLKVFAWAGDPNAVKAWEAAGFRPTVISITDLLPSLSTGMIEGFGATPVFAFTTRAYEPAKFMTDLPWGHIPGATIVSKDVWDRIPADVQPKLLAIAREIGAKMNNDMNRMTDDSIAQMKKNGLKVIYFNDAEKKAWFENAERTWTAVRGGMVQAADFDAVKKVRDEYRASKGHK
ncbi:MAG TPA: TRAP transporter substrate-binding protein DctP, partial [Holophagaceae bacterium]|nr:TRAP transporter substrate-binding protein DctP [Holophagaceae bacterium]